MFWIGSPWQARTTTGFWEHSIGAWFLPHLAAALQGDLAYAVNNRRAVIVFRQFGGSAPGATLMAGAPAAFSGHFHEHTSPRLERLTVALARCIAAGVEAFGPAHDTLWRYACKYGAHFLPSRQQDELREFLARGLLDAILEAEEGGWGQWLDHRPWHGPGARL